MGPLIEEIVQWDGAKLVLQGLRVVIPADQIVGAGMLPGDRRRLPVIQLNLAGGREYQFVGRDVAAEIERALRPRRDSRPGSRPRHRART
jgi:hypothetical protein